jgi:hypothetical protein
MTLLRGSAMFFLTRDLRTLNHMYQFSLNSFITLFKAALGRAVIENKHLTDIDPAPPPPRVCMRISPQGKSCFDLGRMLVLNDPPPGRERAHV